jgi:hypothetical protein
MKSRLLLIIAGFTLIALLVGGCSGKGTVVDTDVGGAEWSRDGKSLYYGKYQIYRYDVGTQQKKTYDMQDTVTEGFSLSPDERRIAFTRYGEGLFVGDLNTGRSQRVYPTKHGIRIAYWLQPDTIVFWEDISESESRIYLLNPASRSVKRLLSERYLLFAACDGSGFLYTDTAGRYRFRNLGDGSDKALPLAPTTGSNLDLLYLDRQKLIYNVWPTEYQYTEILDLSTMRTRRMTLPDPQPDMQLSPDLERYWYSEPYHQDTQPLKLYLVNTPPKVVKQLKEAVK